LFFLQRRSRVRISSRSSIFLRQIFSVLQGNFHFDPAKEKCNHYLFFSGLEISLEFPQSFSHIMRFNDHVPLRRRDVSNDDDSNKRSNGADT